MALMITACGTELDLKAVATGIKESVSIYNVLWQWESTVTPVEKIMVQNPERYTVLFSEEGKVSMQFDCNRGGGDFTVSKNRLSFGPLMSTRMACPEGSLDSVFMKDLQQVASFFTKDGKLYLELPMDSGTMCFRPAGRE